MTNTNEWEKMTWQEQLRQLLINAKCDLGHANQGSIETFVRNLLSRHDKERTAEVVEMVERLAGPDGRDMFWAEIEKYGKSARRDGPQAQAKRDGRDAFKRMLLTTLRELGGERERVKLAADCPKKEPHNKSVCDYFWCKGGTTLRSPEGGEQ